MDSWNNISDDHIEKKRNLKIEKKYENLKFHNFLRFQFQKMRFSQINSLNYSEAIFDS